MLVEGVPNDVRLSLRVGRYFPVWWNDLTNIFSEQDDCELIVLVSDCILVKDIHSLIEVSWLCLCVK